MSADDVVDDSPALGEIRRKAHMPPSKFEGVEPRYLVIGFQEDYRTLLAEVDRLRARDQAVRETVERLRQEQAEFIDANSEGVDYVLAELAPEAAPVRDPRMHAVVGVPFTTNVRLPLQPSDAESPPDGPYPPTSDEINALPERWRKFIHDIETLCDPGYLTRQLADAEARLAGAPPNAAHDIECEHFAEAAALSAQLVDAETRLAGLVEALNTIVSMEGTFDPANDEHAAPWDIAKAALEPGGLEEIKCPCEGCTERICRWWAAGLCHACATADCDHDSDALAAAKGVGR